MAEPQTTDRPKRPPLCDYAYLDRVVRQYHRDAGIRCDAADFAPYVVLCSQLDRDQFEQAFNAASKGGSQHPTAYDVLLKAREYAADRAQNAFPVIPASDAAEFKRHAAGLLCCPYVRTVKHDKRHDGYGTLGSQDVNDVLYDLFAKVQADPTRYLPQTYDSARRQLGSVVNRVANARKANDVAPGSKN